MIGLEMFRNIVGAVARVASKVAPLNERFRIENRLDGPFAKGPCLWMHGASLGECKMLLGLARILNEDIPNLPPILITTQKVEVEAFLKPLAAPLGVAVSIAPLDTPKGMKRFFESANPLLLVLAENELWPGFLSSMRRRFKLPSVALVSGRFYRCLSVESFGCIGFVSMQTEADLARFMAASDYLVSAKAIVGGDWKLLPWALSGERLPKREEPLVDTAFLSFHREELKAFVEMAELAVSAGEAVVVAPRFEKDVPEFRVALSRRNVPALEWPVVKRGAVSVVSSYGKTFDVLQVARSAVVGGSFARTLGVHDFWEPLRMNVPTCIGPYFRGQREAVRSLLREKALSQIGKPSEYPNRKISLTEDVERALLRERERVLASYEAFRRFAKTVLVRNAPGLCVFTESNHGETSR